MHTLVDLLRRGPDEEHHAEAASLVSEVAARGGERSATELLILAELYLAIDDARGAARCLGQVMPRIGPGDLHLRWRIDALRERIEQAGASID